MSDKVIDLKDYSDMSIKKLEKESEGENIEVDIDAILDQVESLIEYEESEYMNESEQYLNAAYETRDTPGLSLRYAKMAFRCDKTNIQAESLIAELTSKDDFDYMRKMEKVIKHGEEVLREVYGLKEIDRGNYWTIFETRPYMITRYMFADLLIDSRMYRRAASELEDLLELSTDDNMGVRYKLMAIYACLEEREKAEKLVKRYKEDSGVHMYLPLSLIYFKDGSYVKSRNIIKKMASSNKNLKKFYKILEGKNMSKIPEFSPNMVYSLNSIEELFSAFYENSLMYMYENTYYEFALETIASCNKPNSSSSSIINKSTKKNKKSKKNKL